MTILAQFQNVNVEILETYQVNGETLAAVKALEGTPFVGGDKWPVKTAFTTARADELSNVHQDPAPEPARASLLDMALTYQDKRQWFSGEAVVLLEGRAGRPLAWLKNHGSAVWLQVATVKGAVKVYILDRNGWELARNVGVNYHEWANQAQQEMTR